MESNSEDGRGTDYRDEGETVESNIAGVEKKLEEIDGTGPINYLAPELIFSILEKIEDDNDRITLSVASKHCLRARCLGLKRITCSVKLRKLLDVVLPSSPNLHSFESSVPLENSDMQLLARSCPELRSLRLGRQRDIDVDFVDDGDIDDDGVTGLGNCKKLVEVVLSGRIRVGDVGVVSMVRGADMLKRLNLEGCVNVGDKSLEAMGGLKRLDNLNVSGCCGITYEGLISLVAGELKGSLSYIDLSMCTNISDNGARQLGICSRLEDVVLSGCENVGDGGVACLVRCAPNLRRLYLDGCVKVGDESLREIANAKLFCLDISGCSLVTDAGLMALADGDIRFYLFSLDLSRCGVNVSEDGMKNSLSKFRWMLVLNLSELVNVTDELLCDISGNCKEIQELYLNGCVGVTGRGRVLSSFKKIETLELVDCINISWADVERAANGLKLLVNLVLDRRMLNPMPEAGSTTEITKQIITEEDEDDEEDDDDEEVEEKVIVTWK